VANLLTTSLPQKNEFYKNHYHHVILVLILAIFITIGMVFVIIYQVFHRPAPLFYAVQANGQTMPLQSFDEPNLMPDTIIRFASEAATLAYNFDFVDYQAEIQQARPYFTPGGWENYVQSLQGVIQTTIANKIIVSGVIVGAPVISNQGVLHGRGYTWRVQIPYLVTYNAGTSTGVVQTKYTVIITIVQVPTTQNPQGIGIDQFLMS